MKLLQVDNLSVAFGAGRREGISFQLRGGDLLQIQGSNGAGKTSLLRTILGLLTPLSGNIDYGFKPAIGNTIAYVPQNSEDTLLPWLNAEENIWLGLLNARTLNSRPYFSELVHDFGGFIRLPQMNGRTPQLAAISQRNFCKAPPAMSGGEKQKVAILRSLIPGESALLILDEPFRELDHDAVQSMVRYIERFLSDGSGAVAYISHQDTSLTPTQRVEL